MKGIRCQAIQSTKHALHDVQMRMSGLIAWGWALSVDNEYHGKAGNLLDRNETNSQGFIAEVGF